MQNRTAALIITIATAVICGCVGLFLCVFGGAGLAGVPVTTEWMGDTNTAPMATTTAASLLCAGIIFVAIPIVVGFLTLRKKPTPPDIAGPLPPAA
jgi:hypothetical protein